MSKKRNHPEAGHGMSRKEFRLEPEEKDYLVVGIPGHGTHRVPLAHSLPLTVMQGLWKAQREDGDGSAALEWSIGFFRSYLGDAMDDLTLGDFMGLSKAWQEASDPSLGESSAWSD